MIDESDRSGMIKCLFGRYTSNLNWFNIPLIIYNMAVHTIKYFPFLAQHLFKVVMVSFVGFFIAAGVVMYFDYKFVFQSERQFMYNRMEYFEDHYNLLRGELQIKRETIIKNRQLALNGAV